MAGKILVVDDERSMCELLETYLALRDFVPRSVTSAEQAWRILQEEEFDVVLTDIKMPGTTGIQLCEQIAAQWPNIPVVVMTGFGSLETAIAAMRAGAYDFVTKPIELDLLALALTRAWKHHCLQEQVARLSAAVERSHGLGEIIGESPVMQRMFDQLTRVAESDASVLITGESGTGKELVARSLHRRSRRAAGPFIAVNCAALPESLLESELFGHVKGAFTDAKSARQGLFVQATGGTLFLDEVGEIPLTMQVKLLRALEERVIRPVGGNHETAFDVRVLSATNRDLEAAIEEHQFRDDLYYRLNVIQLELPPLRARGIDILLIAQAFLTKFAAQAGKAVVGINESAAEKLMAYTWPGNVRELRNVIERAVALTRYEKITVEDLPAKIIEHRSQQILIAGQDPAELVPLAEIERRYILHVLEACQDNKTNAARLLGLDRKTLYRKLKQYGVED